MQELITNDLEESMEDSISTSSKILGDHRLRSEIVFEFISKRAADTAEVSPAGGSIPRLVLQFWDNLTELPEDVQDCIKTWEWLSDASIDRVLFDDSQARNFIKQNYPEDHLTAYERCHHPAMQCDYFRLCYLGKNGGVYVDADEHYVAGGDFLALFQNGGLKLQPLCFDLCTKCMVPAMQFMSEPYNHNRIYYFNNNPIVARKNDPVVELALQRATEKLLGNPAQLDIQATTGPGNLTESLLLYAFAQSAKDCFLKEFQPLIQWDKISISKYPLSYRSDNRNWRNHKTHEC